MAFPTPDEVRTIAATVDPVARNHAITAGYRALSEELRRRLPGAANWCSFAVWASRQAGVTIRQEDALEAVRIRLRQRFDRDGVIEQLTQLLPHRRIDLVSAVTARLGSFGPVRRAADAVGAGNQKVFGEIAFEFARFLTQFSALHSIDDDALDAFTATLPDAHLPDDEAYLRQAFRAYRRLAMTTDPQERAEWMLLANLSIGYYEQLRVQPEIAAAMEGAAVDTDALADALMEQLGAREGAVRGWLLPWVPFLASPVRRLMAQVASEASAVAREVVTEHLMTLRVDNEVIRLSQDLYLPCPPELQHPAMPALKTLITLVDPSPEGPAGSGAIDWADFPDRMHFIAEFFRTWQQDPRLFGEPGGL